MSRLLTMLSALAALLVLCPPAQAATVGADFAVSEVPRLKVGFLHNLSESAPSDGLLAPLGPTAWRSNDASAPEPGARAQREPHDRTVGPLVLPGPRVAAPGGPAVDAAGGLRRMGAAVRAALQGARALPLGHLERARPRDLLGRQPPAVLRDVRRRRARTARGTRPRRQRRRPQHERVWARLDRGAGRLLPRARLPLRCRVLARPARRPSLAASPIGAG
jgi:hypothetical protein